MRTSTASHVPREIIRAPLIDHIHARSARMRLALLAALLIGPGCDQSEKAQPLSKTSPEGEVVLGDSQAIAGADQSRQAIGTVGQQGRDGNTSARTSA